MRHKACVCDARRSRTEGKRFSGLSVLVFSNVISSDRRSVSSKSFVTSPRTLSAVFLSTSMDTPIFGMSRSWERLRSTRASVARNLSTACSRQIQ